MALQGPSIGDAYIDIHANTDPFDRKVQSDLEKAGQDAEGVLDEIGKNWGQILSNSTSKELEKHGKDFARSIERATETVKVKVKSQFDIDNDVVRDARGRFMARLEREVEEAIVSVGTPGGPFNRLGSAIADAIGAGFNISGRSPLISILIPVVGAIVGLVAAALQAVNALVAVLTTLPGLLAALGAQAAIVMVAFQGMGEAIQGALAAKNAKELNEALKNLTPSAQNFVRTILDARDGFRQIQRSIQEQFFAGLGNIIAPLMRVFDPVTMSRVSVLARNLGEFFRSFALFFASPTFKSFLNKILPATSRFLERFGPSFVTFLNGLIKLAEATLPFFEALGAITSSIFEKWGKDLEKVAKDKGTQKWLSDMEDTLQAVRDLFGAVVDFLAVFLAQLDEAGGITIIEELTENFSQLAFLLASPVGLEFMKGIINLSKISLDIVTGLIEAMIFLVAGVNFAFRAIGAFFQWLHDSVFVPVGNAILSFFRMIGQFIIDFFNWLGRIISGASEDVSRLWRRVSGSVTEVFQNALNFITSIPDKIVGVFKNAGTLLFGAGQRIIGGLNGGIAAAIPSMVSTLQKVAKMIPENKGPEEKDKQLLVPAGKATMEGFSEGLRIGAANVQQMLADFTNSIGDMAFRPNGSSITFGRDSIKIGFEGALPTEEQAVSTGRAVGAGITGALAQRNVRLAVRTL